MKKEDKLLMNVIIFSLGLFAGNVLGIRHAQREAAEALLPRSAAGIETDTVMMRELKPVHEPLG